MDINWLWWGASVVLIAAGVAGTVLPVLPGTLLVLAGVVLGAWIDDFTRVGAVVIAVEALLAALAWLLDYVAGLLGARRVGASPQALAGAAIGTVAGIFAGVVGVLFLPLVGAAAGEYMARRNEWRALHVGVATWVGMMLGLVAKIVITFVMIGLFVAALVF